MYYIMHKLVLSLALLTCTGVRTCVSEQSMLASEEISLSAIHKIYEHHIHVN